MNVPVLRPIVVRDDPRLKVRPWPSQPVPIPSLPPRSHRWLIALGTVAVMLVAASFATVLWDSVFANQNATASQDQTHTIVFTQIKNGRSQIFTMESDGEHLRQITAEDANTTQVSWSPDGQQLVFVNDIDGHEQIYRIDLPGIHETRLTNDTMRDVLPSWSPSGDEIAYLGIDRTNYSIWIINSDGTNPRKETVPARTGSIFAPLVWSPDGRQIAFASGPPNQANIMLLTTKTGDVQQLTHLPGHATNPSWSPDGSTLVFPLSTTDGSTNRSALYSVRADGSDLRQLTSGVAQDFRPSWSPDGTKIAFVRTAGAHTTLAVINADGSNFRSLAAAPAGQSFDFPTWTPEGRAILFVQHAFPNSYGASVALESIDTDGSDLRTLSTTLAPDSVPLIQPLPH